MVQTNRENIKRIRIMQIEHEPLPGARMEMPRVEQISTFLSNAMGILL